MSGPTTSSATIHYARTYGSVLVARKNVSTARIKKNAIDRGGLFERPMVCAHAKIILRACDFPSIFAAYRIRRVRGFVARPEAGFFVAGTTRFWRRFVLTCPRLIN